MTSKAQVSLEFIILFAGMMAIFVGLLPFFHSLSRTVSLASERSNLKSVANQLVYYCQKSHFFEEQSFEIELVADTNFISSYGVMKINSSNFNFDRAFQCNINLLLEKGKHTLQLKQKAIYEA